MQKEKENRKNVNKLFQRGKKNGRGVVKEYETKKITQINITGCQALHNPDYIMINPNPMHVTRRVREDGGKERRGKEVSKGSNSDIQSWKGRKRGKI